MSTAPTPPPRRRRPWLAVGIVGFWLVMVAVLLRREALVPTLAPTSQERVFAPSESWLAVRLANGRTVGHVHLRTTEESRHGQPGGRFELESRLDLEMLGQPTSLDLRGWVWRAHEPPGDDRPSAELDFQVGSAAQVGSAHRPEDYDFRVTGTLGGGALVGELVSVGETLPLEFPVDDPLIFGGVPGASFELPLLEVGDEVKVETFDPLTLGRGVARVRCLNLETLDIGGERIATRHLRMEMGGFESHAWIDERGEVVRAETPVGLVIERAHPDEVRRAVLNGSAAEEATEGDGQATSADTTDLLAFTAIQPTGLWPQRGARAMTVALSGVDDLTLPTDGVQVALGEGRYRLTVPEEPSAGQTSTEAPEFDPTPFLEADLFVQSDHPTIRDQARAIVGEETDPWRKALAIQDWVFVRLDKEAVLTVPSALEVLESRRGDCNEHTVLFTALARAVDLPTRIAIGVVWSDELDGFYYHAWPEVYLADGWRWLDPTLGQPLADATHLKLLVGGIERWPQLLPYLGKLQIEVEDLEI